MPDLDRFAPPADARPEDAVWPPLRWPVPADAELVGQHVRLRPLQPERDGAELFAALDHEVVWRHLGARPATPAEHVQTLRARAGDAAWQQWLVRSADGRVLGTSSYLDVSVPDARLEIGSTAYAPEAWGSSVNPECKLLLMTHAFEALGAGRVQLKTDVRNVRSQQAIARLGARCEGVLRRYQRRADGTVRDTVLFSVTAEEWPQVRDRLQERVRGSR